MNRVYLGVYLLGTLLIWEAMHNYGQEMRKQAEVAQRRLKMSMEDLVEFGHIVGRTFEQLGITMEQAMQQFQAYERLLESWHFHVDVSNEAMERLMAAGPRVGEFAPEEVYIDLCWRCEVKLTEAEMDFGLCDECKQELEEL